MTCRRLMLIVIFSVGGITAAWAQDLPPRIIDWELYINNSLATDPTNDFDVTELDILYLDLTVDVPTEDGGGQGDDDEQIELFYEKISQDIGFGAPPAPALGGDTDEGQFQPLELEPLGGTLYKVRVPPDAPRYFEIPDFNGVSQQRLRGQVDYDVAWSVRVRIWNADSVDEDQEQVPELFFNLYATENPSLRPTNNAAPIADAGPDQLVQAGTTVTLDGSGTFDPYNEGFDVLDENVFEKDNLVYSWEWISGPIRVNPTLKNDNNPATWEATLDLTTTDSNPYVFRLAAQDQVNSTVSTDTMKVFVRSSLPTNRPPNAVAAGPSEPVLVGTEVTLDGSGSTDPDNDQLLYTWRQTNRVGGQLEPDQVRNGFQPVSGLNSATSKWRATTAGNYYFRLLVEDRPALQDDALEGQSLTDSALISVQVVNAAAGGDQASALRDNTNQQETLSTDAGAPALGCGGSLLPLTAVPLVLWLARGRRS